MGESIKNSGICIPEQDIFISKRIKNCSPNFKCHLIQEFAYMQSVHNYISNIQLSISCNI